jgi:hypothetical protein
MLRALLVGVLLAALASPAAAQEPETRAEELWRKQQEKAARVAPYKPFWIEKRLFAIERAGGLGVTNGWFVTFGDIKSGSGFAGGPAYGKLFDNGTLVYAKAAYSIRNFKMAQVAVQAPPAAGKRLLIGGRLRWQDAPTLPFYPIGTNSPKNSFDFSETKSEASARAVFRPVRVVRLGGGAAYEDFDTTHVVPKEPDPSLALIAVPGSGTEPSYAHGHVLGAFDSRDGTGYSRRGSLLQATWNDYRQQNGDGLSFQRLDAVAEQYVPILHGNWVIYAGLRYSTTSAPAGNAVPFYLLPHLGGNDLRGYSQYRFRDRHSILLTLEYRWYVQEFADMAIFYDAGKVAPERSQIDLEDLKRSIGVGLRFHGPETTVIRLEVATSREGWRFIFGFTPVGGR